MRYEVRLEVDPSMAGTVEEYMRQTHIPEIMATGCFVRAHFDRAESGIYRTTYVAETRGDFDRYIAEHFARFREAFLARFPTGIVPARELFSELEAWP